MAALLSTGSTARSRGGVATAPVAEVYRGTTCRLENARTEPRDPSPDSDPARWSGGSGDSGDRAVNPVATGATGAMDGGGSPTASPSLDTPTDAPTPVPTPPLPVRPAIDTPTDGPAPAPAPAPPTTPAPALSPASTPTATACTALAPVPPTAGDGPNSECEAEGVGSLGAVPATASGSFTGAAAPSSWGARGGTSRPGVGQAGAGNRVAMCARCWGSGGESPCSCLLAMEG